MVRYIWKIFYKTIMMKKFAKNYLCNLHMCDAKI